MKIEGVIINDVKAQKYFAFIKQFPGICAQSDTVEGVQKKIDTYFSSFMDRMTKEKVDFSDETIAKF
jgi:hypothetical protein